MINDLFSHLEGEKAVENLAEICSRLKKPYFKQLQFKNGYYVTGLTEFLEDNPGCMKAIFNWIKENYQEEIDDLESDELESDCEG